MNIWEYYIESNRSIPREFSREAMTRAINARIQEVAHASGGHHVRLINIPLDLDELREQRGKCKNCNIPVLIFSDVKSDKPNMHCGREMCIVQAQKRPDKCRHPRKIRYKSKAVATLALLRLMSNPRIFRPSHRLLTVYLCPCGYYHLGHRRVGH